MDQAYKVCIQSHWMSTTRLLSYLKMYESLCNNNSACKATEIKSVIKRILKKMSQSGNVVYQRALQTLYEKSKYNYQCDERYIALAYNFLLYYETCDGCRALIEQIDDRVHRCESAFRASYFMTLTRACDAYHYYSQAESKNGALGGGLLHHNERDIVCPVMDYVSSSDPSKTPRFKDDIQKMHFMVETYLDTHKEKAFLSAMQEPARFYYNLCNNIVYRDHVNVHGLNGYLCIIEGSLGCKLPIVAMKDDPDVYKGCCNHWKGLTRNAWEEVFSKEENFGKQYEGMTGITNTSSDATMLRSSVHGQRKAETFLRNIRNGTDARYDKHANRFAFFFRKEFLVKKMFEFLNQSEEFRMVSSTLFDLYKTCVSIEDGEDILSWLYNNDDYILNIDRAETFFGWCGICVLDEASYDLMKYKPKNDENILFDVSTEPLGKRHTHKRFLSLHSVLPKRWRHDDLKK